MPATDDHVIEIFAAARWRLDALRAVSALGLPDCWVAAGFLRNPIWDRLHGYTEATPLNDIDVVYFDSADRTEARDHALERQLLKLSPGLPWSLRNQARMHLDNGDRPYASTEDALRHWLETVSAVGIRLTGTGELALLAPFGFYHVFALKVRPTPHALDVRLAAYRTRMARKDWPAIWPRLTLLRA